MIKRVFFLGAGFSKAIDNDYPLMKQLTHDVKDRIAKSSVKKHYGEIAKSIKGDIESLLTYLSTDYPWKTDTTRYSNRSLYEEIIKIISQQFSDLARSSVHQNNFENIGFKLIEYVCTHTNECNFITLNYDILLENLLCSYYPCIKFKSEIFGNIYQYPMSNICSRNGRILIEEEFKGQLPTIIKLHGSVNWFWAGRTSSDTIYYRTWEWYEENNIDIGLKPYIIPPVMDKNAFYNHIAIHSLWQQAEQMLKEADEIYIIGFSFPQTDLSVKYLFQSALRQQSDVPIYVINPETEQTLRINYDKVFGQKGSVCYEYTGEDNVMERFIKEHLLLQKEAAE